MNIEERKKKEQELLKKIDKRKKELIQLQEELESTWTTEDRIYRFYHQSFKTYNLQYHTEKLVSLFCELLDYELKDLNPDFLQIYREGTGKEFSREHNERWLVETRPILEAYFHAKHMLDMMIKYGVHGDERSREGNPSWFTVLYLYNIR